MTLPPDQPDYSVPALGPISKESRLCWSSQLSNHGVPYTDAMKAAGIGFITEDTKKLREPRWHKYTGDVREGKFFPRGCRGYIPSIDVYCRNTTGILDTLRVYISPQPGLGPTYQADIQVAPGAAGAWRSALFRKMWNYDSLFISIVSATNRAEWAYDTGAPYDYFFLSSGCSAFVTQATCEANLCEWEDGKCYCTWNSWNYRLWMRVNFTGETAGDVPVSGTLNTIPLPNMAAARQFKTLTVIKDTAVYDTRQDCAGTLLMCMWLVSTDLACTKLLPRILADGELALPRDTPMFNWNLFHVTATSLGICLGPWSTTDHHYNLITTLPIPFKRSLQVGFLNSDAAADHVGYVSYVYERLR